MGCGGYIDPNVGKTFSSNAVVAAARPDVRGRAAGRRRFAADLCHGATYGGNRTGRSLGQGRRGCAQRLRFEPPINPQATLDAFVQSLGDSEAIRFRRLGTEPRCSSARGADLLGTVPDWFVRLLVFPEFKTAFPVMIEGKQVGDIVFAPDMSADVYEKWIGFLAIACSGISLMLLTGAIAHFAARSALRPLQNLGRRPDPNAIGRLRAADCSRRPARDSQERAGSQRTRPHPQSPQPGQPQPAAPDRVAAGRRAAGYGARASRRTRAAAVRDPRQHGGAAGIDSVRPGEVEGRRREHSAVGRNVAAGEPPHPRPAAAALHPGARPGAEHPDAAAEREGTGARASK